MPPAQVTGGVGSAAECWDRRGDLEFSSMEEMQAKMQTLLANAEYAENLPAEGKARVETLRTLTSITMVTYQRPLRQWATCQHLILVRWRCVFRLKPVVPSDLCSHGFVRTTAMKDTPKVRSVTG